MYDRINCYRKFSMIALVKSITKIIEIYTKSMSLIDYYLQVTIINATEYYVQIIITH